MFATDKMTPISCLIKLSLVIFLTSGISKPGRGQTNTGKPQSSVPLCSLEQLVSLPVLVEFSCKLK